LSDLIFQSFALRLLMLSVKVNSDPMTPKWSRQKTYWRPVLCLRDVSCTAAGDGLQSCTPEAVSFDVTKKLVWA